MIIFRPWFGEHLNSALPQPVELGGKRVLVDADFTDRGLRRHAATGEPVDVDLRSIGSGGRSGQRQQIGRDIVAIVGECFQVLAFQHQRCCIVFRANVQPGGFIDGDPLGSLGYCKSDI